MDMLPNDEQEALLAGACAFLATSLPLGAARWRDRKTIEAAALREFAALGWYGLSLPERAGGAGLGLGDEALLLAEAGKHLAPIGLLSGLLSTKLVVADGADPLASRIMSGECRIGLALPASDGSVHLIDALDSERIVVLDEDAIHLACSTIFENRERLPCLDGGVTLERAGQGNISGSASDHGGKPIHLHVIALVSALMVGLAESVMAIAVSHAKERHQFGQPIGAFQGVKHPLAHMAVRAEAARFQTMVAALSIAGNLPDAAFQTHAAAAVASSAATANACAAVQVFGAMGYTQECVVHHFVKRAVLLNRVIGGRLKQLDFLLERAPDA